MFSQNNETEFFMGIFMSPMLIFDAKIKDLFDIHISFTSSALIHRLRICILLGQNSGFLLPAILLISPYHLVRSSSETKEKQNGSAWQAWCGQCEDFTFTTKKPIIQKLRRQTHGVYNPTSPVLHWCGCEYSMEIYDVTFPFILYPSFLLLSL